MKLRIRHTKLGKIRFTSHRDTARHWERAVRRAGLAIAHSSGFTPRPRMSFGLALPTGAESLAEFLDMELAAESGVTVDDLDRLPGVGPATAAAIVAHREQHGPFRDVDALADVRGIGEAKLETLRGLVVV